MSQNDSKTTDDTTVAVPASHVFIEIRHESLRDESTNFASGEAYFNRDGIAYVSLAIAMDAKDVPQIRIDASNREIMAQHAEVLAPVPNGHYEAGRRVIIKLPPQSRKYRALCGQLTTAPDNVDVQFNNLCSAVVGERTAYALQGAYPDLMIEDCEDSPARAAETSLTEDWINNLSEDESPEDEAPEEPEPASGADSTESVEDEPAPTEPSPLEPTPEVETVVVADDEQTESIVQGAAEQDSSEVKVVSESSEVEAPVTGENETTEASASVDSSDNDSSDEANADSAATGDEKTADAGTSEAVVVETTDDEVSENSTASQDEVVTPDVVPPAVVTPEVPAKPTTPTAPRKAAPKSTTAKTTAKKTTAAKK
jgi:hypothetical protein